MKPDEEIRQNFDVELSSNSMVCINSFKAFQSGEDNIRSSELIVGDVFDIYKTNPDQKFNVLVDIRKQKIGAQGLPKSAIGTYDQILNHQQTKKIAVVGNSILQRVVINIILGRPQKKVRWFSDMEEAKLWF